MPKVNSDEERMVIRWGFSFVSTNSFGPWAKLPKHSHTDFNTHLIVSGSMIMIDYGVDGYHYEIQSTGLRPRDRYDVPAHVSYGGMAGPEGVVFVEGRKNLSAGVDHRIRGLPTPGDLVRPYVPIRWTGTRAKVVEYESRGYTPGDSRKTADSSDSGFSSTSGYSSTSGSSSTSGFSLNSVSSRSSLTPVESPHDWRLQHPRTGRALFNEDDDNDGSPVESTWAWLWQRYWYGTA